MKKGVVLFALGLMSWTIAGSAFAGPFGRFQRGARPPQQQHGLPRGGQNFPPQNEQELQSERADRMERNDRPGVNGQQAPRNGEAGRAAEGGAQQVPSMPGGRAGARMSLEERQKLRRQINEAGRSLYTPPGGSK